ncbi:MAG: DNA repair protein RecO [Chloroflexi bacterium]|nr:DNA repair protein RecO [Chloroflexota bacterium]
MRHQRLYRTPAVVLKRMDLGEADRIVTFFSRDVGKVKAVARGVRRTTSRSAGHLEPFTLTDVLFAVGRELDVVSQAATIEAFREVREDLTLATHAYYLAEMVDALTEERMENRAAFITLTDGLGALCGGADPRLVLVSFHLRLMEALGYRPELRECLSCRAEIAPRENYFSAAAGGVLCPACGPREAAAHPIDVPTLKLLRFVQHRHTHGGLNVPGEVAREAEALLRTYAEYLVERRLRSPALIARLSGLQ